MDEHKENLIPNSTQIPNLILDLVVPRITEGEARCLLYICRRTFGFHKQEDNISFSQFENGIKTSQGRQLDYGTGMSRPAINNALQNLIKVEAIFVTQRSKGNRYSLNLSMDVDKVVNLINQLRKLTRSGKQGLPKSVNLVNPQKIGKKEKPSFRESVGPPVDKSIELAKLKSELKEKFTLKIESINTRP